MPRDLFAATFANRPAPKRSKWTIAGSFVAHVLVLTGMLVVPVLSALDNYVVQARNITFAVPPPPVMPVVPAPPPKTTVAQAPMPNPNAAPPSPPENPVVGDAVHVPNWAPVPSSEQFDYRSRGPGGTGVPGGTGSSVTLGPPPKPAEPIRPGGNVSVPTRITYVDPIYPQLAIAIKKEGTVILEATIDETGVVQNLKVLRSIPLLDQAAMDAVKRWRYTPTRLNGVAVPILLTVTVTFALR